MNFLVDDNRIKIFKTPLKKDKNKEFIPTEYERDIMPSIRRSDFVKSRHILNIVSESAKIAIRDYIDDVTLRSNTKIERVAEEIANNVTERVNKAGKVIPDLLMIKDEVMNLAEEVKVQSGQNILSIIKRELTELNEAEFEEDFESIMFFKSIYDKTETYFSNLVNKTYS